MAPNYVGNLATNGTEMTEMGGPVLLIADMYV